MTSERLERPGLADWAALLRGGWPPEQRQQGYRPARGPARYPGTPVSSPGLPPEPARSRPVRDWPRTRRRRRPRVAWQAIIWLAVAIYAVVRGLR